MVIAPRLSRTDWQAVSVALNDAAQCGCGEVTGKPGAVGRLLGALTGNAPRPPLADPRLEAIRRFVCATRRGRRPADAHVPGLIAQGFSRDQIDALALLSA